MKGKKRLLYILVGVAGISVSFLLYAQSMSRVSATVAEQEETIVYPAQYSDTHITGNAVATDRRFKDRVVFKKENFLAGAAGSLQTNTPPSKTERPEKGTWLWTPVLDMTPAYWNTIIAGAKKNGVNAVYLSIDTYLDIYVMPDGPEKEQKKKVFDDILESFIAVAHKNGIAVDAEAGWRNWAEPGNEYKAVAVVNYVLQFNAAHAEKLRGFQYDIEPYLLSSYAKKKRTTLHNFVNLVDKTVTQLNGSDLEFSVAIPYFYDGTSEEASKFFYGWNYGDTLTHLLNLLERRPGSMLLVMAYRNQSEGTDGSIDISQDEVRTANRYHTKVVIAQETGDVSPPSVTFYNTSLSDLNMHTQNIEEAFANDTSYNGIAIHYVNALIELK